MKNLTPKEREAIVKEEMAKLQAKEQEAMMLAQKEFNDFMEQWSAKHGTKLISVIQITK
jgi:hypothetical protein